MRSAVAFLEVHGMDPEIRETRKLPRSRSRRGALESSHRATVKFSAAVA